MTSTGDHRSVTAAELSAARAEHRRALEEWRRYREEIRWAVAEVAKERAAALAAFKEREGCILARIRGGATLDQLQEVFHASRRYLVRLRELVKLQGGSVPRDLTARASPSSHARGSSRGTTPRPS